MVRFWWMMIWKLLEKDRAMDNAYIVWKFKRSTGTFGARRTIMLISDIEKNIQKLNNDRCDPIDWMNFGLFMDQVMLGGHVDKDGEDIIEAYVYGIYREDFESKAVYEKLVGEILKN